ncbi:hypothetical protein COB57_05265 [Candidatus Peregrinibacteria bacterium]|nr:MAG: hypothetical protein COB57_05265 [Candidatus Peregrinibacteria bacterium]
MSLVQKIISNTFIQFAGRILSALLAIISVKIITNFLGRDGYGMYSTVYEYLGLFAIIGDFGLYTLSLREMSQNKDRIQHIYSNIVTLRSILSFIVLAIVTLIAFFIPKYQGTIIPIGMVICSVAVWLNLLQSIVASILQYKLSMKYATISLIVGKIAAITAIAASAYFIQDKTTLFYFFLAAGIIGHLVMLIGNIYFSSNYIIPRPAFDIGYWKSLMKESWSYGLALVLGTIYFKVDVTLISLYQGDSAVGFYSVCVRIIEVLVTLPLFFLNSTLGTLTEAVHNIKKNAQKIQNIFEKSYKFLSLIGTFFLLFILLFPREIISVISSDQFLSTSSTPGSDSVLPFLIFALLLSFFSTLCSFTMIAFHQQKKILIVNIIGTIINISLNIYAIPHYSFIGAAYTTIISEIFLILVSFFFLRKVYPFTLPAWFSIKMIFLGFFLFYAIKITMGTLMLSNLFTLILGGILLTISYPLGLIACKIINVDEIQFLMRSKKETQ